MTRVFVTGTTGQLGSAVVDAARRAGHDVEGGSTSTGPRFDLTDPAGVSARIEAAAPDVVVHTAAWTAVDECELDPARADAVNGQGTRNVAAAAAAVGAHVVYLSTDYVFDGTKPTPYVEDDPTNPLSAYGRSKLAGEHTVLADHTVVRTSWVCSSTGSNMVHTILRLAGQHEHLRFVDDQIGRPTFTADLAPVVVRLGLERVPGTFHITNDGTVSWFGFAQAVMVAAGLDPDRVLPVASSELQPPRPAPRPANSVLDNAALRDLGWDPLPHFDGALERALSTMGVRS